MKNTILIALLIALTFGLAIIACKEEPEPAHVHQWGEWEITTAANCTTEGVETRICTIDPTHKVTQAIAIDPNAHNW